MKLVCVLLLLTVVMLLVNEGDTWGRRRWFRTPRFRFRRFRFPRIRFRRFRFPRIRFRRFRIPRIRLPRIRLGGLCKGVGCGLLCKRVPHWVKNCCRTACPYICSKIPVIGKRGFSEQIENMRNLQAMPSDFSVYDNNNDQKISREEFANALRSSILHSREAFDHGDGNKDDFMDMDEFDHAPFYRDENDLEDMRARILSDDEFDDDDLDDDDGEEELQRMLEDDDDMDTDDDDDADDDKSDDNELVRALEEEVDRLQNDDEKDEDKK